MLCEVTYINPDVGGLLIDNVWLCVFGHSLQAGLPLSWVICDWDEEGWRQQHQLQFPLTSVQQHCPATRGTHRRQNFKKQTNKKKLILHSNIALKHCRERSCIMLHMNLYVHVFPTNPHSSPHSKLFDCEDVTSSYNLPSLVHPTLAMYSVPGNKEVKGLASSLSCVLTICRYVKHTHN